MFENIFKNSKSTKDSKENETEMRVETEKEKAEKEEIWLHDRAIECIRWLRGNSKLAERFDEYKAGGGKTVMEENAEKALSIIKKYEPRLADINARIEKYLPEKDTDSRYSPSIRNRKNGHISSKERVLVELRAQALIPDNVWEEYQSLLQEREGVFDEREKELDETLGSGEERLVSAIEGYRASGWRGSATELAKTTIPGMSEAEFELAISRVVGSSSSWAAEIIMDSHGDKDDSAERKMRLVRTIEKIQSLPEEIQARIAKSE